MSDVLQQNQSRWAAAAVPMTPADSVASDLDERRWVRDARRGNAAAFEQLYRRHVDRIYALCLRLLAGRHDQAEDATQETFVAAWRGLSGFAGNSRFSTWLHRIAVNAALQSRRPSSRRNEVNQAEIPENLSRAIPDAIPALDVEAAIASLPDGARHVLVLVALHGHSHAEAADFLGIAEATSRVQLSRARQLLNDRLGLKEPL